MQSRSWWSWSHTSPSVEKPRATYPSSNNNQQLDPARTSARAKCVVIANAFLPKRTTPQFSLRIRTPGRPKTQQEIDDEILTFHRGLSAPHICTRFLSMCAATSEEVGEPCRAERSTREAHSLACLLACCDCVWFLLPVALVSLRSLTDGGQWWQCFCLW